jgi:hypothetical protein
VFGDFAMFFLARCTMIANQVTTIDREGVMSSRPASAMSILGLHFKGQVVDTEEVVPASGIMPIGTFVVCGECSDDGGGSSGQCS